MSNDERREFREYVFENITKEVIDDLDSMIKIYSIKLKEQRILNIISLSDDPASASYMKNKVNMGDKYGVKVVIHKPENKKDLHELLVTLKKNTNNRVIIQCPFDEEKWGSLSELLHHIPDYMDVDGFKFNLSNLNKIKHVGHMYINPTFSPTAKGVIALIEKAYKGKTNGKQITVLGKGLTSGLPIALMCEQLGYTVTWCNSKTLTKIREEAIKKSKIIVSCVGKEMINKETHSEMTNVCYINVGMFKDEDNKLKGDINYDDMIQLENTLYCNKLFGTTGKLTTMCLILNTVL